MAAGSTGSAGFTAVLDRLRSVGEAIVRGGHAFASGRYPYTAKKFATAPKGALQDPAGESGQSEHGDKRL